ncbi:MAG: hypothetical protein J6Y32_07320 [Bacteroidales bacterium]|nr:hypothetical protein [Bacteroidales bacterium]
MIADLAVSSGRVMLPSLGVFVCEGVPASFADKGFTILPPYRRLAFRQSEGDGTLLYEHYASFAKISFVRAQNEVAALVAKITEMLDADGEAQLPGLGKLKRTVSGSLLFVPDEDLDVSAEWMALDAVSLKRERRPDDFSGGGLRTESQTMPESQSASVQTVPEVKGADAQSVQDESTADDKRAPESKGAGVKRKVQGNSDARKRMGAGWIVLIVLCALLLLAAGLFQLGILYFPEWIDRLLYSAEELELLRYFGL